MGGGERDRREEERGGREYRQDKHEETRQGKHEETLPTSAADPAEGAPT